MSGLSLTIPRGERVFFELDGDLVGTMFFPDTNFGPVKVQFDFPAEVKIIREKLYKRRFTAGEKDQEANS